MKTNQELFDLYINNIQIGAGLSVHTVRGYKKDISKLVSFAGEKSIVSFDIQDWVEFYSNQKALSKSSLNGLTRNISAFINWLQYSMKVIDETFSFYRLKFGRSKYVKETKVERLILTDEEADKIIAAGRNAQEKFQMALALKTALRCFEIAAIRMSDINGCEITVHGKGGKTSVTYLNDVLCQAMSFYVGSRKTDSEFLFYGTRGEKSSQYGISPNGIYKRVKRCAIESGIDPERASQIATHTFRRTSITEMAYSHGAPMAQMLARHSHYSTTAKYVQRNPEALRKIMLGE